MPLDLISLDLWRLIETSHLTGVYLNYGAFDINDTHEENECSKEMEIKNNFLNS